VEVDRRLLRDLLLQAAHVEERCPVMLANSESADKGRFGLTVPVGANPPLRKLTVRLTPVLLGLLSLGACKRDDQPPPQASAKEAFEMQVRCQDLLRTWNVEIVKLEEEFGGAYTNPDPLNSGIDATRPYLDSACYSPKHNTCLAFAVSHFNCKNHDCNGTEYLVLDLIRRSRLTSYCWMNEADHSRKAGLGSCSGVYFDPDPKKSEEQKRLEFMQKAQETQRVLEASCYSNKYPWQK
jgi:hypothetical protein